MHSRWQTYVAYLLERSHYHRERCLDVVADVGKETDFLLLYLILLQVQFHLLHSQFSLLTAANGTPDKPDGSGEQ